MPQPGPWCSTPCGRLVAFSEGPVASAKVPREGVTTPAAEEYDEDLGGS